MIKSEPSLRHASFNESEEQIQSFPLLDYVQFLWFRKKVILAITIAVSVYGYIQVNEIKDVYSATSTLLVGLPEARVVNIESVIDRQYQNDTADELLILGSDVLAAKVVKRLNLINHPEFNPALRVPEKSLWDSLSYLNPRSWIPDSWKNSLQEALGRETERNTPADLGSSSPTISTALEPVAVNPPTLSQEGLEAEQQQLIMVATDILQSMVQFQPIGTSNVITITASALDPEIAAAVVNDLPEAFIVDQLEAKFEATQKANKWLTEQLADLETKVVESERAVVLYREQHGLAEVEGNSILDAQMSELNSQLIVARAEKAEIDARLEQLRRLLQSGGTGAQTASEVMSSSLVQQLRTQEAEALSRLAELSAEYGSKHPRMLHVQAEIIDIRGRIRTEVERIVEGLEHESEFSQTRVASIENSLRGAQGETSEQSKEAIQMRALEREAQANRTLFETFLNRFKETSSTQGLEASTSNARILSLAVVPGSPSYPDRAAMLQNYVLMGFLGACGLILALQLLNPGMTSPEQVQQVLGQYVIGLLPVMMGKIQAYDDVLDKPGSVLVEALNSLKFSLALSHPDEPVKAVQITSSVPKEGKTTLVIALARVVAASGKKVIMVDGDLRRSSIGKKLGLLDKHKGLSDLVIAPEEDLAKFIRKDPKSDVDYMPAGTAKFANATDIFSSHRMETIIAQLKSFYDLVLIDTPPVMAVADARIIGRVVDKTVFVVRWDKTPRKVARAAIDQLRRAGVDLAGVVLQQVDMARYSGIGYGDSGYYYHYGRSGKYYSG